MNAERYWITDGAEKSKGDTHFEPESDRSKLPMILICSARFQYAASICYGFFKYELSRSDILGPDASINRAIIAILEQEAVSDKKEKGTRVESNNKDDLSIWHRFMQWPTSFCGKDLSVPIDIDSAAFKLDVILMCTVFS